MDENDALSYQAIINQDKRSFHDKLDQLKLKPNKEQKLDSNLLDDITSFLIGNNTKEVMETFSLGHICEATVQDYDGGDYDSYYGRKRRSADWYDNYGDENDSTGSDYGGGDCSLRLVYDYDFSTLVEDL